MDLDLKEAIAVHDHLQGESVNRTDLFILYWIGGALPLRSVVDVWTACQRRALCRDEQLVRTTTLCFRVGSLACGTRNEFVFWSHLDFLSCAPDTALCVCVSVDLYNKTSWERHAGAYAESLPCACDSGSMLRACGERRRAHPCDVRHTTKNDLQLKIRVLLTFFQKSSWWRCERENFFDWRNSRVVGRDTKWEGYRWNTNSKIIPYHCKSEKVRIHDRIEMKDNLTCIRNQLLLSLKTDQKSHYVLVWPWHVVGGLDICHRQIIIWDRSKDRFNNVCSTCHVEVDIAHLCNTGLLSMHE